VFFARRAAAALARIEPAAAPATQDQPSNLSSRERELLGLVGQGLTDKEIAAALVISLATVRSHLDRIRDKTGRRRRPELTRLADELGLTPATRPGTGGQAPIN
jgi:DNA-binding NarL/FixJ family response regulator